MDFSIYIVSVVVSMYVTITSLRYMGDVYRSDVAVCVSASLIPGANLLVSLVFYIGGTPWDSRIVFKKKVF